MTKIRWRIFLTHGVVMKHPSAAKHERRWTAMTSTLFVLWRQQLQQQLQLLHTRIQNDWRTTAAHDANGS